MRKSLSEPFIQAINTSRVPASDRCHPDDLPIQELEPVILHEHTSVGHPVEFLHAEHSPEHLGFHSFLIIAPL